MTTPALVSQLRQACSSKAESNALLYSNLNTVKFTDPMSKMFSEPTKSELSDTQLLSTLVFDNIFKSTQGT